MTVIAMMTTVVVTVMRKPVMMDLPATVMMKVETATNPVLIVVTTMMEVPVHPTRMTKSLLLQPSRKTKAMVRAGAPTTTIRLPSPKRTNE